jgi:hypothetical protein
VAGATGSVHSLELGLPPSLLGTAAVIVLVLAALGWAGHRSAQRAAA